MMTAEWQLETCCQAKEIVFLVLYFVYIAIFWYFYWSIALKPMRLLSVFIHEFGHLSAAVFTCGKPKGITVNDDESGLAVYSGGCKCCTIPGGYVGGSFWGALFVALSGNRYGATAVVGLITFALLLSLLYKPNKLVVKISVAFTVINVACLLVEWRLFNPFLEYISLFYGVFVGWYSVRDVYDDTVKQTAAGSDAVACSQAFPCCRPRCVGVQFLVMALVFQVVGVYLGVVWMVSASDEVPVDSE